MSSGCVLVSDSEDGVGRGWKTITLAGAVREIGGAPNERGEEADRAEGAHK